MFLAFAQLPTVMAQMSPVLDTQKNKFPQGDHTEFVAGLTSLSKTLGCVFIVRPDTFKLTRVSTPEGNSEITPPPDNVSPDVTKFLNTYDCSATRFGGVYVVQPRFSNVNALPYVSVDECKERLQKMRELTSTPDLESPTDTSGWAPSVKKVIASLSMGNSAAALAGGIPVTTLRPAQKALLNRALLSWYFELSYFSSADCYRHLAHFDTIVLESRRGTDGNSYLGLAYPDSGLRHSRFIPFPSLDEGSGKTGAWDTANLDKLPSSVDRPDKDVSTAAQGQPINTAIADIPLLSQSGAVTVDSIEKVVCIIGGSVDASQLATGIGCLLSLKVNYDSGVYRLEVPNVKGASLASIPHDIDALIPEPYLSYLHIDDLNRIHEDLHRETVAITAPKGHDGQVNAGFPSPDEFLQTTEHLRILGQRPAQLKESSERIIVDYWTSLALSAASVNKPVSQLPSDIQSAIIDYLMADVFINIKNLYQLPDYLLNFNSDTVSFHRGRESDGRMATHLVICVIGNKGQRNPVFGVTMFDSP
jgi:hypothetical protein